MVGGRFQLTCMFLKSLAKLLHGIAVLASISFGQVACKGLKLTLTSM